MEKKKIKLWKKVLIVVAIALILFIIIIMRKFIILSNLENISKDIINSNNYYARIYSISSQGNIITMNESYNKDSKYLTTIKIYGTNITEERGINFYKNQDDIIQIIKVGETKIAFLNNDTIAGNTQINAYYNYKMNIWNKLILSIFSRIPTEQCNNKECYLIEIAKDYKMWIDKQTGLIVREINNNAVTDFYYEFDVVKDEDIVKPDISDCTVKVNE